MRAGTYIVKHLMNEGVKYFFGIPGGGIAPLFNEFYDFPDIKVVLTRHEQGAGFMADGYGRVTDGVAACGATVGPGGVNLASGLHPAFQDSKPVLALTNNVATNQFGKGGIQDSSGWGPRSISHVGLFQVVTKWSVLVTRADVIPEVMRRAFRVMLSGRKGPVHIDIAYDIIRQEFEDVSPSTPETYRPTGRVRGDRDQVKNTAELLVQASNPAILAGGGVIASGASPELLELAELLAIPVATTAMGKSSFPEDHSLSVGVTGLWGHEAANTVLSKARTDVLLTVGCIFHQVTTSGWVKDFGGQKHVQVDIDPTEIGKNYPVDIGIVGDAKAVLSDVIDEIKSRLAKMDGTRLEALEETRRERVKQLLKLKGDSKLFAEPEMFSEATPLKPQRAVREIREALAKDAIVLADCGNNLAWTIGYLQTYFPKGFLADGGHTAMGFSVAAVIGAKLGAPDRQVVDICGNGSFQMLCKEALTASAYGIPAVWCILNDKNLGMIKQGQKFGYGIWEPERYVATDVYDMDFMKFAEACHVYGQVAEKPGEVKEALANAFTSGKPSIIDIRVDPDEFPRGSFKRYEALVKKYPELRTKRMPVPSWPQSLTTR